MRASSEGTWQLCRKMTFVLTFTIKRNFVFSACFSSISEAEGETCVPIKPSLAIINRFLLIRKAGERLQNKGMRDSSIRRILLIPSLRQNFRYLPWQGGLSALSAVMERKAALYPIFAAIYSGSFWEGTASASDTERENFNVSLSALCEDGS